MSRCRRRDGGAGRGPRLLAERVAPARDVPGEVGELRALALVRVDSDEHRWVWNTLRAHNSCGMAMPNSRSWPSASNYATNSDHITRMTKPSEHLWGTGSARHDEERALEWLQRVTENRPYEGYNLIMRIKANVDGDPILNRPELAQVRQTLGTI